MVKQDMKAKGNGDEELCFLGKKDASFFAWPWDNLGFYKYLLYGPFLAKFLYSIKYEDTQKDWWCLHILIVTILRGHVYQLWSTYTNMLFRNRDRRISLHGADFKQIDSEWDWDNFLILQAFVASMAYFTLPSLSNLPVWNTKGIIYCLILHMGLSEPLFYWTHRLMHSHHFFTHYHWLHHSSKVNHPFTAGHATFLEHLALCPIIMGPIVGTVLIGHGSISMIYSYILIFDYLRCLGHCNVEFIPYQLFQKLPFLRYLIYTPTYHSLHHTEKGTNFCLFMPLYDVLGNTVNKHSWDLQKEISSGQGKKAKVPEYVFLVHVVDIMASIHCPFVFRSFGSLQYRVVPILVPMWPIACLVMFVMWAKSKTMLISFYKLRGNLHETWVVPRFGFQYFLPFAKNGINAQIEEAILRADKLGVKVLGLAALNKNEALNGGGTLFIKKLPNLKVRVVHGNTLTAAVIIHQIPKDAEEVFLAGSTSKLGRAISIYLARRRVRVMMLTQSVERFRSIQKELPEDRQEYLVQATSYNIAQHCKVWILGKWITPREQYWAPKGTHFYQFVVPPVIPFRRDCTYGTLVSMRLPDDVEELGTCEYKLPRGVVHACHAGSIVHLLEGWTHHEVGAINVEEIDTVWNAAMKHGLKMA